MLFWFRSHGKTDLASGPLAVAMLQSTASQDLKSHIERPLLLKITRLSLKQVHIKIISSVFTSVELKLTCKTSVTCTCWLTLESISSSLRQNNLKIINLFLRRSQEHQTDFQITFKYYLSLDSNRNLGWFGEFPHIKNSILALAVNCCIHKHYANYVSELCSFGDIFLSKLKNVAFWSC